MLEKRLKGATDTHAALSPTLKSPQNQRLPNPPPLLTVEALMCVLAR